MNNQSPLVSIIIPVYNAEQTLPVCLEALRKQTYRPLELVFINDASRDKTIEVLTQFADDARSDAQLTLKILTHEQNKGVSAARNTGLDHATGDYIYSVDADHWIEPDTIAQFVDEAKHTEADIVGCNWFLTFTHNERRMNQPAFHAPLEALQKLMEGTARWNLWLFFIRRSLFEKHHIRFIEGMNMGEDMMVMIKLLLQAAKVSFVEQALYHYWQGNPNSLTNTYSQRHIEEVTKNVAEVEKAIACSRYAAGLAPYCDFLKLNIKLPLLISDDRTKYKEWEAWFPEANTKIMKNKALSLRTRLLQLAAAKRQYWLLRLYYKWVIQVIYGKLYN